MREWATLAHLQALITIAIRVCRRRSNSIAWPATRAVRRLFSLAHDSDEVELAAVQGLNYLLALVQRGQLTHTLA